jgi:hypothetical protein
MLWLRAAISPIMFTDHAGEVNGKDSALNAGTLPSPRG